jgi:TRAP-type C4-dicarboxylate transport system permease small subunit
VLSLLFFLVMIGYGGALALRTWPQRSTSLGIRMSIPYLAVPVAGLLAFFHTVALGVAGGPRDPRTGGAQID